MTRQTKRRSMLWALFLTILAGGLNAQGNAVNPLWESAVECIMKYESWHGPEHYPYVAFGHRIRPGERFPSRLTRKEGELLLRKRSEGTVCPLSPFGKRFIDHSLPCLSGGSIPASRLWKDAQKYIGQKAGIR